jgi:hypothetical protein
LDQSGFDADCEYGNRVVRFERFLQEPHGCVPLELEAIENAARNVKEYRDFDRAFAWPVERDDLLRPALFFQSEILGPQILNGLSRGVDDRDRDRDQGGVDLDGISQFLR